MFSLDKQESTLTSVNPRAELITRLRAELAKVTWQRNEAQAGLAASRAESERLSSMIDHQRDEAMEMERMLRAELAASRHELENAKKAANAQARLIDSLEQQRAHLNAQRDQWIEARDTLDSERAANATLTEELAASREREARMRELFKRYEAEMRSDNLMAGIAAYEDLRDYMLAEGAQG